MKKYNKFVIISLLVLVLFTGNISSAATVEVVNGKLSSQLIEGERANFTIKVSDLAEDTQSITIETSLIPSDNKPIFDFGDLNSCMSDNRYGQKVTLNKSCIPPKIFQVSISGKVPEGESVINCGNSGIIISKFDVTKLKFYEVRVDQKLAGIESFDLVIKKKEDFRITTGKITWQGFDGVKIDIIKLFDSGLTTEAQNIANDLSNIKLPNNLLLFGIIKIENDFWLNIITTGIIVVVFVVGYLFGSRKNPDEE